MKNTIYWVEAQDGGDPRNAAEYADFIYYLSEPFDSNEIQILDKLNFRYSDIEWCEKKSFAWVVEKSWKKKWQKTKQIFIENGKVTGSRIIFDRSSESVYDSPGRVLFEFTPKGQKFILVNDNFLFFESNGPSPTGDRPFLQKLDLETLQFEKIWESDPTLFEQVLYVLTPDASAFVTSKQSPVTPKNYFINFLVSNSIASFPLSDFPHPHPWFLFFFYFVNF